MAENARTDGLLGGASRHYDGPGLGDGPWACPACGAENSGVIADGCASCGAGRAKGYKVVATPPVSEVPLTAPTPTPPSVTQVAQDWVDAHPGVSLAAAFVAGYRCALDRTMTAPPVTADTLPLAPEGKAARTIIAALELFRDQVLRNAAEEIASGEWCAIEEVEGLIEQLKKETT